MVSTQACQSCAMPLEKVGDFGTEAGGASSSEYCTHCYQGGSFTQPDITMDQMVDVVAGFMEMPEEQAKPAARAMLGGLKRWQ